MPNEAKFLERTFGNDKFSIRASDENGHPIVRVYRNDVLVDEPRATREAAEGYLAYHGRTWASSTINEFVERIDRGQFQSGEVQPKNKKEK